MLVIPRGQGRDRAHQSCAAVPSVLAVAVSYVYVSYFEMLVCGWLVEAPSLLGSVLFLFGMLLVGVCRLSPRPACSSLLASLRVVPRLRAWLCRRLPGPPGVGRWFSSWSSFLRLSSGSLSVALSSISPGFGTLPFLRHFPCCGVSARWRDLRRVVSTIAASSFPPGGHSPSFCCSSQLQIQEAAKARGSHRLRRAALSGGAPGSLVGLHSPAGCWERGLVGGDAGGACGPCGGCGSTLRVGVWYVHASPREC